MDINKSLEEPKHTIELSKNEALLLYSTLFDSKSKMIYLPKTPENMKVYRELMALTNKIGNYIESMEVPKNE